MSRQENGITYVIRDGIRYPLFDVWHVNIPNFYSNNNNSSNSTLNSAKEDQLYQQSKAIFMSLIDPNLNKNL